MRRKSQGGSSVSKEIPEPTWRPAAPDKLLKDTKCVVCGEECAPNSAEGLCWVCRRLKISAWRDADHQMPAQE